MTDYIKEAKEDILGDISQLSDGSWNCQTVIAKNSIAQAKALIAIAEQLRIANLLELSSDDDSYCTELASRRLFDDDNYTSDIAEALGIKEQK